MQVISSVNNNVVEDSVVSPAELCSLDVDLDDIIYFVDKMSKLKHCDCCNDKCKTQFYIFVVLVESTKLFLFIIRGKLQGIWYWNSHWISKDMILQQILKSNTTSNRNLPKSENLPPNTLNGPQANTSMQAIESVTTMVRQLKCLMETLKRFK